MSIHSEGESCADVGRVLVLIDPIAQGNNGEKGVLLITNLRAIWVSSRTRRTNLSVGGAWRMLFATS